MVGLTCGSSRVAALQGSPADVGAWAVEMTEASRPGHSGIVTTDSRKIEWRHDGEVGVAVGAVMVTTEIEASTQVRVRIDPVQQFQHAIDAALAYSGTGAATTGQISRCSLDPAVAARVESLRCLTPM